MVTLLESGTQPLGYIDPLEPARPRQDIPWLGDDDKLLERLGFCFISG